MWFFVPLCLSLLNFCCADAEEIKLNILKEEAIRYTYNTKDLYCESSTTNLTIDKPFQVYVETPRNVTLYSARCYDFRDHDILFANNFLIEPAHRRIGYVSTNNVPLKRVGQQTMECMFYTHPCTNRYTSACEYGDGLIDRGVRCIFDVKVLDPKSSTSSSTVVIVSVIVFICSFLVVMICQLVCMAVKARCSDRDNGKILFIDTDDLPLDYMPENDYEDPETLCGPAAPARDISQRPPLPLPAEERADGGEPNVDISQRPPHQLPEAAPEQQENRRYIHYDTPYDFRIFRIGVPVANVPERFGRRNQRDPRRF